MTIYCHCAEKYERVKNRIHLVAAIVATLCIALFFTATIFVELFGSAEAVSNVKSLIGKPGLFILIPAIAITGASGCACAKQRRGGLIANKMKRMPFIAANGLLILVPCAITLNQWASAGSFDMTFYIVQGVELIAGATNLALMGLNIRD